MLLQHFSISRIICKKIVSYLNSYLILNCDTASWIRFSSTFGDPTAHDCAVELNMQHTQRELGGKAREISDLRCGYTFLTLMPLLSFRHLRPLATLKLPFNDVE